MVLSAPDKVKTLQFTKNNKSNFVQSILLSLYLILGFILGGARID